MRAALVLLITLAVTSAARAQEVGPNPYEGPEEARALFEQAGAAREAGDWAEVRRLLEASLEIYPHFPTAWNLATACERSDDLAAAERVLERIRDGELGEVDARQRRSLVRRLEALAPRLATVNLAVPESIETVEVDREHQLPVDEPGRLRLRLTPGTHEVAIALEDGNRVERSVEVEAGATLRLRLRPPPPAGRLIVEAEDVSSDLRIEGVAGGTGRLVLSLPPDEYRIRNVTQEELRVIRLEAGQTERVYFAIPSEIWESPWLWLGLGALVAAGVAIPTAWVLTQPPGPAAATFEAPPL